MIINHNRSEKKFAGLPRPAALFLLVWFVLNILQVSLMELSSDEGYYWFYAQHLQWGYYDHPPMIAAMIKLGTILFPGELGVRFFNVISSTATVYFFFRLLPDELLNTRKTFLVLLSAPLLHYLTFLVFPDGPLLCFSLLFLVLYRQFLERPTWIISILIGFSLALMAYSKYHGGLVLLFTILVNPRLLKSGYFYFALLIAGVLFMPHLWWQYQNDFPTFSYHLSGRTGTISFRYVGEYLSQQVAAIGPGLIFIPFVVKTKNVFERTLLFIIIGSLVFFLLSSFKTFVHFHWTSIGLFPLLYFAVVYYNNPAKKKLFNFLLLPFVVLFFIARILLAIPLIPAMHVGEDYYHGRKQWAKEIASLAGERPLFMTSNLRESSLYTFYSGKNGVTLYTRPDKKSQYELWGYEDSLQGKEVFYVAKYPFEGSLELPNSLHQNLYYKVFPAFRSYYHNIGINATINRVTDSIEAVMVIINRRSTPLVFSKGLDNGNTALIYSIEHRKKQVKVDILERLTATVPPSGRVSIKTKFAINDLPSGNYLLYFGIRNGVLPDAILSKSFVVNK